MPQQTRRPVMQTAGGPPADMAHVQPLAPGQQPPPQQQEYRPLTNATGYGNPVPAAVNYANIPQDYYAQQGGDPALAQAYAGRGPYINAPAGVAGGYAAAGVRVGYGPGGMPPQVAQNMQMGMTLQEAYASQQPGLDPDLLQAGAQQIELIAQFVNAMAFAANMAAECLQAGDIGGYGNAMMAAGAALAPLAGEIGYELIPA